MERKESSMSDADNLYDLEEIHTPPALMMHGRAVLYFQRPPNGPLSHYDVRDMARLIVAVLNKSHRDGLSVAELRAEVTDLKRLNGELADMLEAVDSHSSADY
jgi:hypothetical protein